MVNIDELDEAAGPVLVKTEALIRSVNEAFENYAKLSKKVPPEMLGTISSIYEPGKLAEFISSHLSVKLEDKQKILEITDVTDRLEKIYSLLISESGRSLKSKRGSRDA